MTFTATRTRRGIFAAHDHDHDHMITRAQLVDVMSMIGLKVTTHLSKDHTITRVGLNYTLIVTLALALTLA